MGVTGIEALNKTEAKICIHFTEKPLHEDHFPMLTQK